MRRTYQVQRKAEMKLLEATLRERYGMGIRDYMVHWSEKHPDGKLEELAREFDCHLSTIYRYIDYFGLEIERTMRIRPRSSAA